MSISGTGSLTSMGLFQKRGKGRGSAEQSANGSAYQATEWPQVQQHRRTLERLARWVSNGNDPESSEHHESGLRDFGADSSHFQAACRGDYDAGRDYHREVADGRFWIFD